MDKNGAEKLLIEIVDRFAGHAANRGVSDQLLLWGEVSEDSPEEAVGRLEAGCAGCPHRVDLVGPVATLLGVRLEVISRHPELGYRLRDPEGVIGSFAMNTANCDFDDCGRPEALQAANDIFNTAAAGNELLRVAASPSWTLLHGVFRQMGIEE